MRLTVTGIFVIVMISAFLHTLSVFRVLDISGSKAYVGLFKGVQEASICAQFWKTTSLSFENILSPSQDFAEISGRGAIVTVTRAPSVIQGYLRLVHMFPSPRLYKLSQTPVKGQRDVCPSKALSLRD